MKKQHIRAVALAAALSAGAFSSSAVLADATLDNILKDGVAATSAGSASQKRIDKLQGETDGLLSEFKDVNKEIEGMRVYNSQLEKQIANQRVVIDELIRAIEQVTVIERQVQPLILRMLDSLEQFVKLDLPFLTEERTERIATLYENMDRADISVSEKFRQVLEAYKIESEYGRKLHTYEDVVPVEGRELNVDILMVGRVSLIYQSKDKKYTGIYDKAEGQWVPLETSYSSGVNTAIRMHKEEVPTNIMRIPVPAPEVVR